MNDQQLNGDYKFQNCTHRSLEQKTITVKRCACQGGDYTDTGYECVARKIFKIEPNICEYCHMFENNK